MTVKRSFPQSKRILPSVSPFNTAVPSTIVIPLEVSRIFTPDVSFLTVRFFRLMILSMSKDGVPSGEMPYLEDVLKLSNILAEYNNVFVGIQLRSGRRSNGVLFKEDGFQASFGCPFGCGIAGRSSSYDCNIVIHACALLLENQDSFV